MDSPPPQSRPSRMVVVLLSACALMLAIVAGAVVVLAVRAHRAGQIVADDYQSLKASAAAEAKKLRQDPSVRAAKGAALQRTKDALNKWAQTHKPKTQPATVPSQL